MTLPLPDVQASSPDIKINLTRVGVNNVKKLVEVARPNGKRPVILISEFYIYVDLPSDIKGANLSRNFEAMYEVLEEALNMPIYEVEELCSEVARRVLQLHEYASTAEVGMKCEYMLKRRTPVMKISCQEPATIFAEAKAFRTDNNDVRIKKTIGAEIVGITTCPCAQELMRDKATEELTKRGVAKEDLVTFLDAVPLATHNQRGRGILSLEVKDDIKLPLGRIISIIEQSMSAKTYEILKRPDEAEVVATAHKKPMFVEDCVRAMAKRVVESFNELPDDSIVSIKQINEESIHQHDAVAERIASIGDLRRELKESDAGVA
ncbi:GTP cyclohydrolase I FolE2 [ANME-1 cluster archaeon AG-394-G21]|nr:GTP cyclohydrolase I FolE2 [ANME-1 cluster archaeon AG-394-G21]NAT10105.1 GTP cyclohydrolase I FolE2 [ANME-1 cluster archaeon AG-394-G06]